MKTIAIAVAACAALLSPVSGAAQIVQCPVADPDLTWTATWTDEYSETTYSLEAPCKVFLDEEFTITATVTDPTYGESIVGGSWSIVDNGAVVVSGSMIWPAAGIWQKTIQQTYTGTPVDHTIEFRFKDLGHGGGGHAWSGGIAGGFTVDPVRPPPASPPVVVEAELAPAELGAEATLTALVADPDGGALAYRWLEGDSVLAEGTVEVPAGGAAVALPAHAIPGLALGAHALALEVSDGVHAVSAEVALDVVDTTPPALAPVASQALFWPPIGRMTKIVIAANATDAGGPVSLAATIGSDSTGAVVLDVDDAAGTVVVALPPAPARRHGALVYTVVLTAVDASGNDSRATVEIAAPQGGPRWPVPPRRR